MGSSDGQIVVSKWVSSETEVVVQAAITVWKQEIKEPAIVKFSNCQDQLGHYLEAYVGQA